MSPLGFIYKNNPVFLPWSITLPPKSTVRIVMSATNDLRTRNLDEANSTIYGD